MAASGSTRCVEATQAACPASGDPNGLTSYGGNATPGRDSRTQLTERITAGHQLVLDTSTLIAYLKGDERTSAPAAAILDDLVAAERNPAVISAVSVAELLVRPYATSDDAVATVRTFVIGFPGLSIRATDLLVAAEAARIRAATGITTPDAIVAATASLTSSRWLVTNDRLLRDRLGRLAWATDVLLLDDLVAEGHPGGSVGA